MRRLTAERGLGLLVLLAAAAYATYSLVRFSEYANGGFDLGIFDEVVWHYSRFETPASSVKGLETIWGDHFSPILMLLAPLYWLWEDARMLLLAQAVLLAVAAVPIFLACERRVGRRPALALAASYLAFWGVQAALAVDVHEVAFAPAIIAGLLLAIQRRRWRWYAGLVLALLAVKEDQAILVVFLGLYVATLGERRRGALTAVAGIAWYFAATRGIIEAHNPAGFSYWSYEAFGSGPVSAVGGVLSDPAQALRTFVDSSVKRHTLALLLLPFLGLCLLSREVILLAPLLAERFLSSNVSYWGTEAHYTLASVAVLVVGAAGGLATSSRLLPERRRRVLVGAGAGAMLLLNVAVATGFPLGGLRRATFYARAPVWAAADRALAAIPPRASVAAQDALIPRLTHRDVAAEISAQTGPTEYIVAYVSAPLGGGQAINGGFGGLTRFVDDRLAFYAPVAYESGWLVLRSRALPPRPRSAALRPMTVPQAARLERALVPWETSYRARLADATACAARAAGPCPGLGAPDDPDGRRLHEVLTALRPELSSGCAELAMLARFAASQLAADLEDVRAAAATQPPDPAALQAAAATAGQRVDANALGYVTRLRRLCTR